MSEGWLSLAKEYGVFGLIGLAGMVLVIMGVGEVFKPDESVVEIVSDEQQVADGLQQEKERKIVVDVAGAVMSAGVYKLQVGARVGEAIELAGGLSDQADQIWVTKNLNLAGELKDGSKIYIPFQGEEVGEVEVSGAVKGVEVSKININTASVSELDSLWGIGESRAKAIIANRPYGSVDELESKAGIPSNVVEHIRDEVSY